MADPSNTDDGTDEVTGRKGTEITYEIGEDERPSEAVVRATAALTNRSVIDLDPLFDVIDPDHLDGLFDTVGMEPGGEERSVTFTFNGCHVSYAGRQIVVRQIDDGSH